MRLLAALLFFLGLTAFPLSADRLALVIGNGAYAHAKPLPNATNDARDMSNKLRRMGFTVFEGIDLTQRETLTLAQTFARTLKHSDTALLYYAGHGMQMGRSNYIMPVDAMPGDEDALTKTSIKLQSILSSMEDRANTRIIILDACRNNPFLKTGSTSRAAAGDRGFMRMDAGVGSFIAFSTEPGNVASDGNARNSPFTAALLRHIGTEGADIHAVMRKVRAEVKSHSNNRQIPWENSSLIDEVYLAGRSTSQTASTPSRQNQLAAIRPKPPQQQQQTSSSSFITPIVPQFSHRVQGLDPNGDGFLALRSGTAAGATRIAEMREGTLLNVLQKNGKWYFVQTQTGLQGWAHSNWIARNWPAARQQNTLTCDQLWYQRNIYFARGGYCFQSARGRAAFGHMPCTPGRLASQVALNPQDRAAIAAIKQQEAVMQCN